MVAPDDAPRLTHQSLKVLRLFADAPMASLAGADMMRATGLLSGTIYPILLRFEHYGILESDWERERPEDGRRRRRLYSITQHGRAVAHRALAELGVPTVIEPQLSGT